MRNTYFMPKKNRCVILIDGSNFYFKLKNLKLHNLLKFDFSGFTKMLADKDEIYRTTYYIGAVRTDGTKKVKKLLSEQQKLFAHLTTDNIRYSLGYLLKTNGKFHEKGVDVQIAVDILITTYENLADRIILVSSDTDLIPAITQAQKKGKLIEYIGFAHQPSIAMQRHCSRFKMMTKKELLSFIK